MKALDLKSVLVAGAIGAAVMLGWYYATAPPSTAPTAFPNATLVQGFVVGAAVQIGVRLTGVS